MAVFHKQQAKPEYIVYMVTFISNSNSSKLTDHNKNIKVTEIGVVVVACLWVTSDMLCLDLDTWELL